MIRLNPATTPSIDSPTEAQIAEALGDSQNEFIILEDNDAGAFMQAAALGQGLYVVEYSEPPGQDGEGTFNISRRDSHRQHRTADDQTLEQATRLLGAFNRRDPSYKTSTAWTDITDEIHPHSSAAGLIVLAIILALAGVALYFYFTR